MLKLISNSYNFINDRIKNIYLQIFSQTVQTAFANESKYLKYLHQTTNLFTP